MLLLITEFIIPVNRFGLDFESHRCFVIYLVVTKLLNLLDNDSFINQTV
mgnify:CR=1 FL=1